MRRVRAYLAHAITVPLMHESASVWQAHLRSVQQEASKLVSINVVPIVPCTFITPDDGVPVSWQRALEIDHTLVDFADFVHVHNSEWVKDSPGVQREIGWAHKSGKPVSYSIEDALIAKKQVRERLKGYLKRNEGHWITVESNRVEPVPGRY